MTKKLLIITAVAFVALMGSSRPVFADDGGAVNQVFQSAKDALDSLVTAKDEGNANDVTLRINAFEQVLDLSTSEAKDLELKLLTADKNPDYDIWVKSAVSGLTEALVYYDSERQLVSSSSSLDVAGIKAIAEDFKTWRDDKYLPLVNQIQDFLLVKQEFSALDTSEKRLNNITSDVSSLNLKTKDRKTINDFLNVAKGDIKSGRDLNSQAYELFLTKYVSGLSAASSTTKDQTSNASSSDSISSVTSTEISTSTIEATSSSSTEAAAGEAPQEVSVKDLVNSSLMKIKDAYRNFIGISNLVRKLLQ
ncbi:hypothetical protein M1506_00925 [Patescibacteria group bacterium]|nr:hypothetical protein [Patescibacteria group bacterium]